MSKLLRVSMNKEINILKQLNEIGNASSFSDALGQYEDFKSDLKEWRIIYSHESADGPFYLPKKELSPKCYLLKPFKGNSIFVIDKEVIETKGITEHFISTAIYVDSNTASYIRSFAYEAEPSERVFQICSSISKNISQDSVNTLNMALYLSEIENNLKETNINKVRETVSSLKSISMVNSQFDSSWRDLFIRKYKAAAEREADNLLFDYYNKDGSPFGQFSKIVDLMELLLLKVKIIEYSSKRSSENKLLELLSVIDKEISIFMPKEIAVCVDILFYKNKLKITRKLNGLTNIPEPLQLVRNCAMDLFMARMLDLLTNTIGDKNNTQFHLAQILTCDVDVWDILNLTGLSAIAVHRESHKMLPIYSDDFTRWIFDTLGDKKLESISRMFTPQGMVERKKRRSHNKIQDSLHRSRQELVQILISKRKI
ncbi:hypothetical protein [Hafnia alvei]|uniref:Uncharacterized protein n=1 Tax=Hafnia alvei TaxID=569 RepID=A0A1C6Z499_HAFAL|nr:hypothetical protein [Hafnia alvei]NLS52872.1 hypothetical protein [Hafnia alvei]SCM53973.1 hypothetical protein BN1044_03471 [Hafnia alvei]